MTQNALTVLRFILAWGWRFFTGYYIPGTNVTPGALLFFIFLIVVLTKWLKGLFNANTSHSSSSKDS